MSINPHPSSPAPVAPWDLAKVPDRALQETANGSQQAVALHEVDVQGTQVQYKAQLRAVSIQLQGWQELCRSVAVACQTSFCLRPLRSLLDREGHHHQREVVVMVVVEGLSEAQVELVNNSNRGCQITGPRITRRLHLDNGQVGDKMLHKYHRHNNSNNNKAAVDEMVVEPTTERHKHKHRARREKGQQQNQMDLRENRTRKARPTRMLTVWIRSSAST